MRAGRHRVLSDKCARQPTACAPGRAGRRRSAGELVVSVLACGRSGIQPSAVCVRQLHFRLPWRRRASSSATKNFTTHAGSLCVYAMRARLPLAPRACPGAPTPPAA